MTIGQTQIAVTVLLLASSHLFTLSSGNASETLAEKITRLQQLEEHCEKVSAVPLRVGESCTAQLTDYFNAEPIWNMDTLIVYVDGKRTMHTRSLNERAFFLRFSAADFSMGEVPRWRDVFDGRHERRLAVASIVSKKPECEHLSKRGAISQELASRCEARELFKYATYLNACTTSNERMMFFLEPIVQVGLSRYALARKNMLTQIAASEERGNGWQLVEKYLLTLWLTEQCKMFRFTQLTEPDSQPRTGVVTYTIQELMERVRPTHDIAMSIAARAGDPWAIQSYCQNELHTDPSYWKSLFELNPLLFHRWMAGIGYSTLNKEDRALHALNAYSAEKQLSPSIELDDYLSQFHLKTEDIDGAMNLLDWSFTDERWRNLLKYPWE